MKYPLIKCERCGYNEDSSKIQLHHIIPKFMGGTDKTGRKYLCEECHKLLHKVINETTLNWLNNSKN